LLPSTGRTTDLNAIGFDLKTIQQASSGALAAEIMRSSSLESWTC
jgi:hypothetical protein